MEMLISTVNTRQTYIHFVDLDVLRHATCLSSQLFDVSRFAEGTDPTSKSADL